MPLAGSTKRLICKKLLLLLLKRFQFRPLLGHGLQLAGQRQLLDDVGAADELARDEDLRDRGPLGERGELLADAGIREDVLEFVQQVVATSEVWYQVATELPILQEASFTGPEVEKTLEQVTKVGEMEWKADQLQWAVSRRLFEVEEELGPVSVSIWMHILEVVGKVANHAENTADLLRLMLARR